MMLVCIKLLGVCRMSLCRAQLVPINYGAFALKGRPSLVMVDIIIVSLKDTKLYNSIARSYTHPHSRIPMTPMLSTLSLDRQKPFMQL